MSSFLLLINAATILLLIGIIIRESGRWWQARRRGRAAARLHVQIVGLFSVIAVLAGRCWWRSWQRHHRSRS